MVRRRKASEPLVLGTQMAAANAVEAKHQRADREPSALAAVAYDVAAGEYDLFRFVDTPTDDRIARAVRAVGQLRDQRLGAARDALAQDDLYALLTFARRTAVHALRGRSELLDAAWTGLGLVDVDRVDWRDAAVARGLLAYGTDRAGAPLAQLHAAARKVAGAAMAEFLGGRPAGRPTLVGFREVTTPGGLGLADDWGDRYAPTLDLLSVANEVIGVVDGDRYRFNGITTGDRIAPVWLPGGEQKGVDAARRRIRACLSIDFALRSEPVGTLSDQMFLVYLAEARTPVEAGAIAAAAVQPGGSAIGEFALGHDRVLGVVIARSITEGVNPVESTASLQWLRAPLAAALERAVE